MAVLQQPGLSKRKAPRSGRSAKEHCRDCSYRGSSCKLDFCGVSRSSFCVHRDRSLTEPLEDRGRVSDHLASERTYLAWLRTGIATIGLGFVVAKFGLAIRALTGISATSETSYH